MAYSMTSVFSFEIQALSELEKKTYDTPPDILDRTTFLTEFDTKDYLKDFYTKVDEPAMQMVLKFLPNIVARVGNIERILDFGAGPTIHVAACFRNTAKEIYLADYLPQNRNELELWMNNKSDFNWSTPLKMILTQEGKSWNELAEMEPTTRKKVCGVYHCDCFADPALDGPKHLLGTFDVIVTTFCIEYCCNNYDEYKESVKRIANLIKPGGHLVIGGILEETWCSFGGRKFTCLYVTREMMLTALAEAGLSLTNQKSTVLFEINGMFLICAQKKSIEAIRLEV